MANRVTQVALEVIRESVPSGRVTQVAVEVLHDLSPVARVTQVCMEVIRPNAVAASTARSFVAGVIG